MTTPKSTPSSPSARTPHGAAEAQLLAVREVLAVVAHPDDESFGLGALLAAFAEGGRRVRVLCLTHGEASTLGAGGDLGEIRAGELACATTALGVDATVLENWPDGHLAEQDPAILRSVIEANLQAADALTVFEPSGITGHPDHRRATALATQVAAERGLLLLEWGIPETVATQLRDEFGAPISGLDDDTLMSIPVDRSRQWNAIACHTSQDPTNPILARRLALTGGREWLRLRAAPFDAHLSHFVTQVAPLVHPDATTAGRHEVLDRLVGLAAIGPPVELPDPDSTEGFTVHCLHDDPAGWTLAAVVTTAGGCTPPHDHTSWGAAATVSGIERNRRYAGTCPDSLEQIDEQLASVGGGYLFATADIHQACDATGTATVSLHLLAAGGPDVQQRCHEPERTQPPTTARPPQQ